MRNKIFSGLLFLSTAAVIIASVLIAVIMYQGSMTTMQRDLRQEATFIKMGLEQSGKSYLQALTMESGKLTLYDRGSAGGGFGGYASGTADY